MIKSAFFRAWSKENEEKELEGNQNRNAEIQNQSPISRIHRSENVSLQGSPLTPVKWSPVITRTNKDEEIPFELPPLSLGRFFSVVDQNQFGSNNSIRDSPRSRSMALSDFNTASLSNNNTTCEENEAKSHQRMLSTDSNDFYPRNLDVAENNGLGKLDPELYKSTPACCKSRFGRVWFSLVYDWAVESLTVRIIKVKQLRPRSTGDNLPRDSFVKLFLLPNEKHSYQTKVRHRSNHPVFNESFSFHIPNSEIRKKILRLSVYDEDKQKQSRSLLGHALINLGDVDFSTANEKMWRDLDDIARPGDTGSSTGELYISLSYIPSVERLSVVVKEAKNLQKFDLDATGIYVKVDLYNGNNITKTRKTSTKMGMPDIEFNEIFHYKISSEDMKQTSLSFTVITRNGYGPLFTFKSVVKHVITRGRYGLENKYGEVTIGSYHSTGEQSLHWQEILSQAPKSIAKWHLLCDAVDN